MALARVALRTILCATMAAFSIGSAAADEPPPPAAPAPPPAASAPPSDSGPSAAGHAAAPAPPAASSSDVSPALIGLAPEAQAPQPPPKRRKLWIALGVVSGVAVVGAIVAVAVTVGTSSSHNNSVFNDWGTVTVTRR